MKKIKIYLSGLIVALVLLQGCDDFLNVSPSQSIDADQALTNADNVKSVLVGAYDAIGDSDLYGGWYMMTADFLAASGEFDFTGTFFQPREIWLKEQLYDNSQLTDTWVDSYNAINIANNALAGLDLLEGGDRARVEGEARAIRGMVYFELVRLFAHTYEAGQTNNQPGLPLILEPTSEINELSEVARSSVEDVYSQIIADLTSAKDLLPEVNPERSFYINSLVASALLSRVHLQMGNYANARDEANRVIQSGNYSLRPTFEGVFNQPENTSEDIFAMQNSAQDGVNSLFTFYAASDRARGDIDINQQHIDEYEPGDARLNLFYTDPGDGALRSGKWNRPTDDNVNLIRLAEMYLTRAEANYVLGESAGDTPLNDLNLIRERVSLEPLTPAELDREAILHERKLELMFEGNLLHDIKRTQRNVGSRPYNDPKLVLPIPQRDLLVNPNLCQNPSYAGTVC